MGDIMDQEEDLDLLDLEEGSDVDTLPEAVPFSAPHPKRPLLLMGLGLAVIVVAVFIIIMKISGDKPGEGNYNPASELSIPAYPAGDVKPQPQVENLQVPPKPVDVMEKTVVLPEPVEKVAEKPMEKPAVKPMDEPKPSDYVQPIETDGVPVRVIEDRKPVTFNPDRKVEKPVKAEPKKKAPVAAAPAKKSVATTSTAKYYAQIGSYSTQKLAQQAEQKLRVSHNSLFADKQFVILAASPKGQTVYRLRVPFASSSEANGFCVNAKSDGLDCYVTK